MKTENEAPKNAEYVSGPVETEQSKPAPKRRKAIAKKVGRKKGKKVKPKYAKDKPTVFKIWCTNKGITQKSMRQTTNLSLGCVHNMWMDGRASDSTITLLSFAYNVAEEDLKLMITSWATDSKETNAILKNVKPREKEVNENRNSGNRHSKN